MKKCIILISLLSLFFNAVYCGGSGNGNNAAVTDSPKEITNFEFTSALNSGAGITSDCIGTISGTNISVTVPYGANVTNLIATFTTMGKSVSIGSTLQTSGITANNFSGTVTYTVTAADNTTKDYFVIITMQANPMPVIHNVNAGSSGWVSYISNPVLYNSKIYFDGCDNNDSQHLYGTDGSTIFLVPEGTSTFKGRFSAGIVYNSRLYFMGANISKYYMYEYDGSSIKDVSPGSSSYVEDFSNAIIYNSRLYFLGRNSSTARIYQFDGTQINNVNAGTSGYDGGFGYPIIYNSRLYFYGTDGSTYSIYQFDGTEIKKINAGTSGYDSGFRDPIVYNSELYFMGINVFNNKDAIFKFDDSVILHIWNTFPYECPIIYNSNLYFNFFNASDGSDLHCYFYNGTSFNKVDKGTSSYDHGFTFPIEYNSKLYFGGFNLSKWNYLIYEFNGTTMNDVSDSSSDYQYSFVAPIIFNSKLYFGGNFITPPASSAVFKAAVFDGIHIKSVGTGSSDYYRWFEAPIICGTKLFFIGLDSSGNQKIYYIE